MRQRSASKSSRGKAKPPVIYIVDDEPLLVDLAEASLAPAGFNVKKFTDPEEALKAFTKARPKPDVLVTDYAMGKMNGLELLEKCREQKPGLKCLLISGTVGAEVVLNAPTKVDRFVGKPYQPENLLELVRRILGDGPEV
jgi:DNA-binding NtrC family response regulator